MEIFGRKEKLISFLLIATSVLLLLSGSLLLVRGFTYHMIKKTPLQTIQYQEMEGASFINQVSEDNYAPPETAYKLVYGNDHSDIVLIAAGIILGVILVLSGVYLLIRFIKRILAAQDKPYMQKDREDMLIMVNIKKQMTAISVAFVLALLCAIYLTTSFVRKSSQGSISMSVALQVEEHTVRNEVFGEERIQMIALTEATFKEEFTGETMELACVLSDWLSGEGIIECKFNEHVIFEPIIITEGCNDLPIKEICRRLGIYDINLYWGNIKMPVQTQEYNADAARLIKCVLYKKYKIAIALPGMDSEVEVWVPQYGTTGITLQYLIFEHQDG